LKLAQDPKVLATDLRGSQGAGAEQRCHTVLAGTAVGVYKCDKQLSGSGTPQSEVNGKKKMYTWDIHSMS